MSEQLLDILLISDLHYICEADYVCPNDTCNTSIGPLLLRKSLQQLKREKVEVELMIILGDMVENGLADGAEKDLSTVAEEVRSPGLPFLALPGNHDKDFERFSRIFGCRPGLHVVGGYGFILFHDFVGEGEVTTRPPEGLDLPGKIASVQPELPLVALQHNPLHPHIENDFPYMLTNADAVLSGYGKAGVILSLSGHYHAGQPAHRVGNITCYTVPAACREPFCFAHVRLRGREVEIHEHALLIDVLG